MKRWNRIKESISGQQLAAHPLYSLSQKIKTLSPFLLLFVLLLAFAPPMPADDKAKLQKEYEKLQEEIEDITNLIEDKKKEKEKHISELSAYNDKIATRKSLIANIDKQIGLLDQNISENEKIILTLESDLEELRTEYGQMIVNAYRNRSGTSGLLLIFSAESFNQAFNRFNYLRRYGDFRQQQADAIEGTIAKLEERNQDIVTDKAEQLALIDEQSKQTKQLELEKEDKKGVIADLSEDEKKLKGQIDQKNKDAQALNDQIQAIIKKEIEDAKKKAEKENPAPKPNGKPSDLYLTDKEIALSKDFVGNKGKLPWPVAWGRIIGSFGKHQHPDLPGVYVYNNGVDIKTNDLEPVRAVFEGEVISIFYLATNKNNVIIKHGEYFTVYSFLKGLNVQAGDKVSTKDIIGVAAKDDKAGISKVHFELWKGQNKNDPAPWLVKQ